MIARSTTLIFLAAMLAVGCDFFDEPIYVASARTEKRWRVGERPTIVGQLTSASNILVIRGEPGEVAATLRLKTISKTSQATADQRLRASAPGARFDQEGDPVRIIELPENQVWLSLTLIVPPDSDLDFQAPYAEFCVGCNDRGSRGVSVPVARLKAATERILNARVEGPSFGSPVLDLEAGQLNLTIDGSPVKPTSQVEDAAVGVRYRCARP